MPSWRDVLPSDSEFERLSDDIKHVFVCTLGALSTWEKTLHSALSKLNNIHMVTIYTSEEREQGESLAPIDVYEFYGKLVADWIAKPATSVQVRKSPITLRALSTTDFLLPTPEKFFPRFPQSTQLEIEDVDKDTSKRLKSLAATLVEFGASMSCRLEVWALGATSAILGQFVNHATANASSQLLEAEFKASLVLIDRTFDLVGPALRGLECVADRYTTITELPVLHTDHQFGAPAAPPSYPSFARVLLTPHERQSSDSQRLYSILLRRPKEALTAIKKEIIGVAQSNSVELPTTEISKAATTTSVRAIMRSVSQYDTRLMYKYEEVMATAETICSVLDESITNRKGLNLQEITLMKHMLATQDIQHVIDDLESPDCQLTVESALVAIVLCFSLQNTDYRPDSSQISSLKAALITLLQQKPMLEKPSWIDEASFAELEKCWRDPQSEHVTRQLRLTLEDAIDSVLDKSVDLVQQRTSLSDYPSVLDGPRYASVASQVAHHVLNKRSEDLRDLNQITFSVRGLLKSGFSRLGFSQQKPRPTDRPMIIFFFVGGLSFSDIRDINDAVSTMHATQPQGKSPTVLVGSTHLATPILLQKQFFGH